MAILVMVVAYCLSRILLILFFLVDVGGAAAGCVFCAIVIPKIKVAEREKKRQAMYKEEAKRRRYQSYLKSIMAYR